MRILALTIAITLAGFSAHAQNNAADQFPVGGVNAAEEPREVVKEVFEDWEIRCTNTGTNCFMYQLMLNAEGTPVAELSMIKLPMGSEAVSGVTVVVPLGTMLTRGLIFGVDGGEATQYPFSWCTRPGCFARFGLTDLMLANMQKGEELTVAVFSIGAPDVPVEVTASLKGFTAAFDALEN